MPDSREMPWQQRDSLSERVKLMCEWQRRFDAGERPNISELCRMYGVSRETGHKWIKRFVDAGCDFRALDERSRRPATNPRAASLVVQDLVVEARKRRPKWGPVLLRRWLVDRYPRHAFPGTSTIGAILRRRGMTAPRKRRRRANGPPLITPPFPECTRPNATWCMDFKGWFRTLDREKCYPFTLLDAFSRFLLRCEALLEPNGDAVRTILDSAFREYGLPAAIRSDGGPPFFATNAPSGLSMLGVWLLRLGITLECIAPAKPQQNGRLERFHRTLKHELDIAIDVVAQQRLCDEFRGVYNFERPHSALELATPGSVFRSSRIRYPRMLLRGDAGGLHSECVDHRGRITWRRQRIFISEAFVGEWLTLWPAEGRRWEVYFGSICIGVLDESRAPFRFQPLRRPRKSTMRLAYSPDESVRHVNAQKRQGSS
jgi:transposase InsO family protein